jgi:hypothetical protein
MIRLSLRQFTCRTAAERIPSRASMRMASVWRTASLLAACVAASHAGAASSLEAITGVVGGAGGGCGTFVPVPELSFFTFTAQMPLGGYGPCGYSGGYTTASAPTGPLNGHTSLGPVILGPPGSTGFFDGTADARASYKSLGAAAHANIAGGLPGSSLAMFQSTGAATFSDTLTVLSPFVASFTAGTVRYRFSVDGSLSSLGAPGPFLFGETYAVLDVQHQGGPVFELMNAHVRRGGLGTISGNPPPAGWVTSMGSLSGGSTVEIDMPMVWGQPWDLKVGLLAWAYGTADTNFLSTARLTGLELFDADHHAVTTFSITSASGTDYASSIPEPSVAALLIGGLLAIGSLYRRR